MPPLGLLLDVFGIATALLAAWLVTAINRSNLLNGRAALAAAASAASLAVRFAADLLARL